MDKNIEKIVENCRKGDLSNFGRLFDAFQDKIYRFIYFRTHHKETAEDLTSVVFTKALEHMSSFTPGRASFSTWLYQIARNTVIDHYRTKKEFSNIEDAWDVANNSSVERDTDTAAQLQKVKKYLQTLPAQQRDVVIMRVWDGLSHREIAEILGITEANAKVTFSRVLAKLNKDLAVALLLLFVLSTKS